MIDILREAAMIDILLIGGAVMVIGVMLVAFGAIDYLTRPTDEEEG